jgi:hypothetical protein
MMAISGSMAAILAPGGAGDTAGYHPVYGA